MNDEALLITQLMHTGMILIAEQSTQGHTEVYMKEGIEQKILGFSIRNGRIIKRPKATILITSPLRTKLLFSQNIGNCFF